MDRRPDPYWNYKFAFVVALTALVFLVVAIANGWHEAP